MWYLIVSIPDLCTLTYFCLKKLNDYADEHDASVVILIAIFFQVVTLKIKIYKI